jgi:small subunit ribosomal protein S13
LESNQKKGLGELR